LTICEADAAGRSFCLWHGDDSLKRVSPMGGRSLEADAESDRRILA
jgi:hypothetical protein